MSFVAFQKLSAAEAAAIEAAVALLAPVVAELRQTAGQSLTHNTAAVVTFGAEDVDTHGGHSTVSNTSRYTAQVAGWYWCAGGVSFASNGTGRRAVWWRKNGTEVDGAESVVQTSTSGVITLPARSKLIQLAVGDYVELVAYQDSGVSINTSVAFAQQQSSMSISLQYRT